MQGQTATSVNFTRDYGNFSYSSQGFGHMLIFTIFHCIFYRNYLWKLFSSIVNEKIYIWLFLTYEISYFETFGYLDAQVILVILFYFIFYRDIELLFLVILVNFVNYIARFH